jgi:flagellar basal body-associated protein FliL
LFNEYQIRLTNAPTPNLKKIYQSNLQELNTAFAVLQGNTAGVAQDLPSASPTYRQVEQQSSGAQIQNFQGNAASQQASASNSAPAQSKKEKSGGDLTKKIIPLIVLSVLAIAVAVFFGMSDFDKREQLNSLNAKVQSADTLAKEINRYKLSCDNQILKIKNDGSDFYITGVSVTYWNEFNKLEKQEIPYYSKLLVRGGGSLQLSKTEGSKVQWDGSVVSYAIGIEHNSADFFVSGIFSKDMKPEDKTLHLNFDNF